MNKRCTISAPYGWILLSDWKINTKNMQYAAPTGKARAALANPGARR
jgi:hypothetical protein